MNHEAFQPESLKPSDAAWTAKRKSRKVYAPRQTRKSRKRVLPRKGSVVRTRCVQDDGLLGRDRTHAVDVAVRESPQPSDPTFEEASEWLEGSPEQKIEEIIRAGKKQDWPGVVNLLTYYYSQRDRDPWLAARIRIVLMFASDKPEAWSRALDWLAKHGSPREQVWAARWVLIHKIGAENVIRAWDAEGMGLRPMAALLGPGYSKTQISRIRQRIEEEDRMNANAVIEIKQHVDQRFDRIERLESMRAEAMDQVRETVEQFAARFPCDDRIQDAADEILGAEK
jgi:hypothetical protein